MTLARMRAHLLPSMMRIIAEQELGEWSIECISNDHFVDVQVIARSGPFLRTWEITPRATSHPPLAIKLRIPLVLATRHPSKHSVQVRTSLLLVLVSDILRPLLRR